MGKKGDEKVREPKVKDGVAFVDLNKGERYIVRLFNNADVDTAVDLSIDGINVYEFSTVRDAKDKARPKFRSYVVPKGKSVDILAWHVDMVKADQFEVSGYGESEAAKLGKAADGSDIGQITAVFRAAWPKGTQPPKGEGIAKCANGYTSKLCPPPINNAKEREVEFGNVWGSVVVRYSNPATK